ncbi:MAG TPA: DUF3068 domain-containing protein [Ornithinibacter sp.]|nr:DUF3068 domain-containing protein [Ornithinibacter sp.]
MRRAIGGILVLLGALFIGIGLLAKPYLYEGLAIAPLDQQSTSVSQGTDMDVLYPHVVDGAPVIDKLSGVTVTSTRQVVGIPGVVAELGVEDTDAFWQTTVKSQATVDGQLVDLSYSDTGVSLDRRTGEATNCCGDYTSIGDLTDPEAQKPITHEGLVFKFPFGVQQTTYQWWDADIERAEPIEFQGEEEIGGTKVYVFKQVIEPEPLVAIDAPASLFEVGATGTVTATEVYSNTRTLYVEPVTGVVIEGREEINSVYEADGYEPIAKTVGTIGFDDETVAKNAKDWGAKASLLSFIDNWLMLVGLALGVVLIGLGGFLLLSPGRDASSGTRVSRRS